MPKRWAPGHYLQADNGYYRAAGMQDSERNRVRYNPYWAGYMVRYWWRYLEPTKNAYDFSQIITDLDKARADGKMLWVRFMCRSFTGYTVDTEPPCPGYLSSEFNGIWADNSAGRNIVAPRYWDTAVGERYCLLIEAMAAAIDGHPALQGVMTEEVHTAGSWNQTSVSPVYSASGVNAFWATAAQRGTAAFTRALWHTIAGWAPDATPSVMQTWSDLIVRTRRSSVAPTDLAPAGVYFATTGNDYGAYVLDRYRGEQIALLNHEYDSYLLGTSSSAMVDLAVDTFGCHFVTWEPTTGGRGIDSVIAALNANEGKINKVKPSNVTYYDTTGGPTDPPPSSLPQGMPVRPRVMTKWGSGGANVTAAGITGMSNKPRVVVDDGAASVAPTWVTLALPDGAAGAAYTTTVEAIGVPNPVYALVSPPSGWSINSATGVLTQSALPNADTTVSLTITATVTGFPTISREFTILVRKAPTITTTALAAAVVGTAYYEPVEATGTGPFTWSLTAGASALAALGLSLGAGAVSGIASALVPGAATITIRATDANGAYAERTMTAVVLADDSSLPTITTTSLPTGTVGTPYSAYIAASGSPPFAYSIIAGALAAGLTATHVIDWDVALTGASLRTAMLTPSSMGTAGWILQGAAAARLGFSARSSIAWQKKADGTYEPAAHNLLAGSNSGISAGTAVDGQSNVTSTDIARLFAPTVVMKATRGAGVDTNCGVGAITTVAGQEFTASCYVWIPAGSTLTGVAASTDGTSTEATVVNANMALRDQWQRIYRTGIATGTTGYLVFRVVGPSGGICYHTGWEINLGPLVPYVPTDGAAVYGPAIDWVAADGGAYEIRSEESRTNNIRNSARLGAVVGGAFPTDWLTGQGVSGLTISVAALSTLAGLPAVDVRFQGTHASASYVALGFFSGGISGAANGQTRTLSFLLQLVAGTLNGVSNISAYHNEVTSGGSYVINGRGSSVTPDATVKRATLTRALSGGGTVAKIDPYLIFDTAAGQAIDFTLRIACPQEELGATASSPIITYGAAATRGEDQIPIPDTSPSFISQTGGLMWAEFTPGAPGSVLQNVATIDDGTANHRVVVARQTDRTGRCDIVTGGASQGPAVTTSTTAADGALSRLAFTWKANDATQSMNGSTAQSDTSISLPTVTGICVGNQRVGSRALNGSVRSLYYRKIKHPAATVVALSGGNAPTVGDRLLIAGTPTPTGGNQLIVKSMNDFGADTQVYDLRISPAATSAGRSPWDQIIKVRRG